MRLFLCEKPSQGRDLAAVLGATRRGEGFLTGNGVTVTWAVGHLLETAPPGGLWPAVRQALVAVCAANSSFKMAGCR